MRHKNVIVLYMNLRPEGDKKNFPPRDQIPAQILTEELHTTAADYEIRCCAFFTAIFIVLRVDLLKLLEQDPSNFTLGTSFRRFPRSSDRVSL